ncbi:MAG: energy-coupling factor ABC transporter substrate-binding protein, partial [Chloroflexus sp.]|nr:energy-coupling factor ABC transporter substrate-binding protein [Chloroflexus sp.]
IENSEFPGADMLAEKAIQEIAPDAEPWFRPLWEPPGSETESLLFALQAAIGAGFIGYFFGRQQGRKEATAKSARPEAELV